MKTNLYLLLIITLALFSACKKDNIDNQQAFQKSYQSWLNFKTETNNNYRYTVKTVSWTGFATSTLITVKNGKVIARTFVATTTTHKPTGVEVITHETWTENEATLNTHDNAAQTLTLDEVYHKAKTIWLVKRKDAKTSFETKNNGIISSCGFIENGCQDDCFSGINIASVEKGI